MHHQVNRELLAPKTHTPAGAAARGKPKQHYHALYVLYYAGHGDGPDGHFCLEKLETVALDDILQAWEGSAPFKAAAGCKLLIVADSCHAGAMAMHLQALARRGRTRLGKAARSVAVQAACGPSEIAIDGCFTGAYIQHVARGQRIMHRQLQQEIFGGCCGKCGAYRQRGCGGCAEAVRKWKRAGHGPMPGSEAEMPWPLFSCGWGAVKQIATGANGVGGKPFPLYKRS